MKIITILTDFGSLYPAQMKGVILSRLKDKEVIFVDIAHDIPHQNIQVGAFALLSSVKHFPIGTIHLAVVDPGVGTERLGIIVESGGQLFVGPNNGLLFPAAKFLGEPKAFKINNQFETSSTFHGRDVFAPVVALLVEGQRPQDFGSRVRLLDLSFGKPTRTKDGIEATILYVDRFGNLILNLRTLPAYDVSLKGIKLKRVKTYAEGRRIEPLITIGSQGFAEIAVNQGSAADAFCCEAGDRVKLEEI